MLLYFRVNYEEDKVQNLLNKKELWKYYIEILPINHKYYFNIEIPDELINEILKQKVLSYSIIKGTLSYITSNKNILISINNNCNSIFEFCSKTETILNMNDLIHPNEIDDLKEIIIEIVKIITIFLCYIHWLWILNSRWIPISTTIINNRILLRISLFFVKNKK